MKEVFLTRITSSDDGILGVLHDENNAFCVTLEDPWLDNKSNVSCIPKGQYYVVPHNGTRFTGVWQLLNVPSREGILIHKGNSHLDTHGCILVGSSYVPDVTKISGSQLAFDNLKLILPDNFSLIIR